MSHHRRASGLKLIGFLTFVAGVACSGGGGGDTTAPDTGPRHLAVTPDAFSLADCLTQSLTVSITDAQNHPVTGIVPTFTSSDGAVASVSASGVVTAHAPGSATITIHADTLTDTVAVTITQGRDSLVVSPTTADLLPTQTQAISPALMDCHGVSLPGAAVAYSTGNAAVATVSPAGVITAGVAGLTTITATEAGAVASVDVAVLGHPGGVLQTPTSLSLRPFGVAASRGGAVYVTQLDGADLARFDLPGRAVTASVTVGFSPTDVTFTPDGKYAYDTDQNSQGVSRITVSTNSSTGGPTFTASTFRVKANGSELFVTDNAATLHILDATSGGLLHNIGVGADPNGLAFSPDGTRVYVSNYSSGTVSIVSRVSNAVVDTWTVGGGPQDIAVIPDGSRLYVANESGGVQIWNTATATVVDTIPLPPGRSFGLAISPDGARVYVGSLDAGAVYIIDTGTNTVIATLLTGGVPRRIAFSRDGTIAVIANESGWVDFVH